jgi:hypothetical protein
MVSEDLTRASAKFDERQDDVAARLAELAHGASLLGQISLSQIRDFSSCVIFPTWASESVASHHPSEPLLQPVY